MPEARGFPWAEAMRFGLGVLRLSPASFWATTPRELGAALMAFEGARTRPPERTALEALMAAFPDTEQRHG